MYLSRVGIAIASLALALSAQLVAGPARAVSQCSDFTEATSGCPTSGASTDGRSVSVRAEQRSTGGSASAPLRRATGSRQGSAAPRGVKGAAPARKPVLVFARGRVTDISTLMPRPPGPGACSSCTPARTPTSFAVSVSDLVNFVPAPPDVAMEPNGWAVVGVPANFIARTAPETQAGPLLGADAEVRFTPVQYSWNYGDGPGKTTTEGGQTWQALGLPEFTETPTSHRYAASGEFSAQVEAAFRAEYRYAGMEWQAVSGIVTATSHPLAVLVAQAKTVLVSRDCAADRGGPGC